MHRTVRGGKSTWAFDQGSGGYQGLPTNEDPEGTNLNGGGQDPGAAAAGGGGGWEDEFRELCQLIQTGMSPEDATRAEGLVHRLMLSGESANAMGGEAMPVGRPTPVTQDAPPGFRGVPRTGARDGYRTTQRPPGGQDAYAYRTMQPQAADGRPRGSGPGGAIMACDSEAIEDVLRRGRARQAAKCEFRSIVFTDYV
jgi:hypothetical protein